MREKSEVLFSDYDLRGTLEAHEQKMGTEIDGLDRRRALETSLDELCDHFEKEYRIEVPRLDETQIKVSQKGGFLAPVKRGNILGRIGHRRKIIPGIAGSALSGGAKS